jgi:hypothetical protein
MTNPAVAQEGEALPECTATDIVIEKAGCDPRHAIELLQGEFDRLTLRLALVRGTPRLAASRAAGLAARNDRCLGNGWASYL